MNKDFHDFIEANKFQDPNALRLSLKKAKFDFDVELAILQIEVRKKQSSKLKKFFSNPSFLIPDSVVAEQASHQAIASYHAALIPPGSLIADLTAGLGIDAFTLAERADKVVTVELDSRRALFINKNSETLGLKNIISQNEEAIRYLQENSDNFDVIFVDPSRRGDSHQKVYNLHDCRPDVLSHQDLLVDKAQTVLIKASPMLDITQTLKDFDNIRSIRAIGVKGECKEILVELSEKIKDKPDGMVKLEAVDLDNEGNVISDFSVVRTKEGNLPENLKSNKVRFASKDDLKEGDYLLQPSAMIMKLSPWPEISSVFKAMKLGPSSNLFLTSEKPSHFPGRVMRIKQILKKSDLKNMAGMPVTVVSKNHPLSADRIRKTFGLKEGDDNFIYATRLDDKPVFILASPAD